MDTSLVFTDATGQPQCVRRAGTAQEPLFCVKDICACLGITTHQMKQRLLHDDEKVQLLTDTPGGKQKMTFCTEPGLYNLILSCRDARQKGSASHRFYRWVTHDVLPSIRKTGQYVSNSGPTDSAKLEEIKLKSLELRLGLARDLLPLWKQQREECDPDDMRQKNYYRNKESDVLEKMHAMITIATTGSPMIKDTEPPRTITEIMDVMGGQYRTYAGQVRNRIYVGRRVAAEFRERYGEEPTTTIKLMDTGHRTPIKCYHERDWEWIHEIIEDCFSS